MAKKQTNVLQSLSRERYLIWAIVFMIVVGVGLMTEIARAKTELDIDMNSSLFFLNIKR